MWLFHVAHVITIKHAYWLQQAAATSDNFIPIALGTCTSLFGHFWILIQRRLLFTSVYFSWPCKISLMLRHCSSIWVLLRLSIIDHTLMYLESWGFLTFIVLLWWAITARILLLLLISGRAGCWSASIRSLFIGTFHIIFVSFLLQYFPFYGNVMFLCLCCKTTGLKYDISTIIVSQKLEVLLK